MKRYLVEIGDLRRFHVEVEADTTREAKDKAWELFEQGRAKLVTDMPELVIVSVKRLKGPA